MKFGGKITKMVVKKTRFFEIVDFAKKYIKQINRKKLRTQIWVPLVAFEAPGVGSNLSNDFLHLLSEF